MPPNQQMETKASIKPLLLFGLCARSPMNCWNGPWTCCPTHAHTFKLKTAPLQFCITVSWWFDSNGLWSLSAFIQHTCILGMNWPGLMCPQGSLKMLKSIGLTVWLISFSMAVFRQQLPEASCGLLREHCLGASSLSPSKDRRHAGHQSQICMGNKRRTQRSTPEQNRIGWGVLYASSLTALWGLQAMI